jgi:hypothetical protein
VLAIGLALGSSLAYGLSAFPAALAGAIVISAA